MQLIYVLAKVQPSEEDVLSKNRDGTHETDLMDLQDPGKYAAAEESLPCEASLKILSYL